ncbi:hypothetical protein RJD38_03150 [Vibrio scophthalmi]|uniref:Outer membrane protein beta-barrel domain-containing protein n=1 Tax=Vibrio scophthalmi TaxID=45658 RepID=A0A1C7F8H4_9VIBR|nr:hypothetical protein [Vibrio scophthalmi]ANU35604.1 hypothetical protein VSVS05_00467 [Vibrio scophthalmi]
MNKISLAIACLGLAGSVSAAVNFSLEKDFVEIGLSAALTERSYLFVGADSDDWLGVGIGYKYQPNPHWRLHAYYEYGLYDDWLLNDMADIDGVKTKSHLVDLSATRYWQQYSLKAGVTAERVRNGFTWITVDDANKYSAYAGIARYFQHIYLSGRYEHHYATDESDMIDFNQGHANEWEVSIGTMKPIWHFYPYAKVGLFSPNGSYYGMTNSEVTWTIGGAFSF